MFLVTGRHTTPSMGTTGSGGGCRVVVAASARAQRVMSVTELGAARDTSRRARMPRWGAVTRLLL
jgi:hypothetical protein